MRVAILIVVVVLGIGMILLALAQDTVIGGFTAPIRRPPTGGRLPERGANHVGPQH